MAKPLVRQATRMTTAAAAAGAAASAVGAVRKRRWRCRALVRDADLDAGNQEVMSWFVWVAASAVGAVRKWWWRCRALVHDADIEEVTERAREQSVGDVSHYLQE